ncbi:DUF5679 domain-containing protein [[Eubacterium] cellulosolvens]
MTDWMVTDPAVMVQFAKAFMGMEWGTLHTYQGRRMLMVEMFCVKCKEKRTVPDNSVTKEKTAKGRNMIRAVCPVCGTKMVKFVK